MSIRSLVLSAAVGLAMVVAAQAQSFPVTIEHAYGQTTIPAKPQRIVTWGWAAQDAVIALGEVPVGIPHFSYGGDENGALTWTKDAVAALGADFPTILPDGFEAPVEAIAALEPDLIIAVYSGLTAEEYDVLSGIAPVVAFPETAWSTPWQQTITITGQAMGKKAEGEALVAELEQFIADETAKYPELAGASFATVAEYNGEVAVYANLDSRVKFLVDAGMVSSPAVTELAQGESFYFSLSYESFEQLTADVLVSYFETADADASFFGNPVIALHPQVQEGAVAHVVGAELINSISPPSALSLKWGYPQYIKLIADAVKAGKAE
ncbi:ABC transporter substrate-binding protein [Devosia sp. XJ19-1]|uniref:ABC transporter substrate-binding protein n=1 Tax=Devosia ureilytica TaxID=2952754 RepID=A0A9Q4FQ90_9HYPH|nr:ABC transporter substrate-binding protein [Devosia ureilytica]MCP8882462.1 ABC transporter substrate-binding protein [Devosia ureilytica]MCP8885651.1 ABC transporter substrate-binding protein [Devosia ureilytica]